MQHASAEAYEKQAQVFRDLANRQEARGAHRLAADNRARAEDCEERAAQVRNS